MWQDKVVELRPGKEYYSVGAIVRCKPPHIGHISFLEGLCQKAEKVVIGIGSANKYDADNPFFAIETEMMLDSVLSEKYNNYEFTQIPDFSSDQAWIDYVKQDKKLGRVSTFVSSNPWVQEILGKEGYEIRTSYEFMINDTAEVCATDVREMIANDGPWEQYVSEQVGTFIKWNNGVERIKKFYRELEKEAA